MNDLVAVNFGIIEQQFLFLFYFLLVLLIDLIHDSFQVLSLAEGFHAKKLFDLALVQGPEGLLVHVVLLNFLVGFGQVVLREELLDIVGWRLDNLYLRGLYELFLIFQDLLVGDQLNIQ